MSQPKNRDYAITVYPLKYEGAQQNDIEEAESNWLHDLEHGPYGLSDKMVYLYGCMERGKNHKLHCHYRVYFQNQVRLSTLQKIFSKNIKVKRTISPPDYELYIRKEGKFSAKADTHIAGPWTYGDRPAQGKPKKAWEDIKDLVKAGTSNAQILEQHPFAATQMRAVHVLRTQFAPPPPLDAHIVEHPYSYQSEVIRLCSLPPEHRRWIWVWSHEKGLGKTQLGDFLITTYGGLKSSLDLRSVLELYDQDKHKVIVFDLPRLTHLSDDLLNWFEKLSDGTYIMSDKNSPLQKYIFCHLVIISNHAPPIVRFGDRIKAIEAKPEF